MAGKTYVEDFNDGPGGWFGWNCEMAQGLEIKDGVAIVRGPWSVDPNHAPPGAGYLHILFCLCTREGPKYPEQWAEVSGPNRFVQGNFPTDFTNARMTLRLRGEMESRGAELVLLAQAGVGEIYVNSVLTAQPFKITPAWHEQTITLAPDANQWTCLGARHDLRHLYGWGDMGEVLRDLDFDIILVLFPLNIVPAVPIDGDQHLLRAGKDYRVDQSHLPEGYVMLDWVRMEFAGA